MQTRREVVDCSLAIGEGANAAGSAQGGDRRRGARLLEEWGRKLQGLAVAWVARAGPDGGGRRRVLGHLDLARAGARRRRPRKPAVRVLAAGDY